MLPLARHPVSSAAARAVTARSARGDVRSLHASVPSASAIGRCAADHRRSGGAAREKRQEARGESTDVRARPSARSSESEGHSSRGDAGVMLAWPRVLAPLCAGGAAAKKYEIIEKIIIEESAGRPGACTVPRAG